jgi:uncharacterized MnhB-related membrane protein
MNTNVWIAQGVLRDVLKVVGTLLAANGVADAQQVEAVVGGVLTVAGFVWSIYDKQKRKV